MAAGTTSKSEYARTWDRLIRILRLRDHARAELIAKLSPHAPDDLITRILADAAERGLLSSDADIAARVRDGLDRRLKSALYIEQHLNRRGLTPPARANPDEIEAAKARELIERKFGDPLGLSPTERERAFLYLKNRGFDDRDIRRVFANAEY